MKSKINELADYREAPFQKEVTIACPAEHINVQMKHLTRKFKKTESVSEVAKGDVVVLSLVSELTKFNRPMVPITVGSRLFDEELEAQLIHHSCGESFTVTVQNQPVNVTIKQASRTLFPQPTDEMAAVYATEHEEFAGITTVAQYRQKVIEDYCQKEKQSILYQTMDDIMEYVLTHSDWDFDEDELAERVKAVKMEINTELKEEKGQTLEDLSTEDLKILFGVESFDEMDTMLRIEMERVIASDLWLLEIHQKQSIEEIENNGWAFLEEYVKANLQIREEK